jgi:3-hydroxyacyl-[acyl-carrier-protein] dehydratase
MLTETELDLAAFDYDNPLAGIEQIRDANPQRFEFEMLSGIVHIDPEKHQIIGFKSVAPTDFWVRGHMPNFPLFPGVLMCEAAAQLCGYYYVNQKIGDPGVLLGLGGLDETRFVRTVRPGERLVLVGNGVKVHRRMTKFRVVGFVHDERVFETLVTGVPLGKVRELQSA